MTKELDAEEVAAEYAAIYERVVKTIRYYLGPSLAEDCGQAVMDAMGEEF